MKIANEDKWKIGNELRTRICNDDFHFRILIRRSRAQFTACEDANRIPVVVTIERRNTFTPSEMENRTESGGNSNMICVKNDIVRESALPVWRDSVYAEMALITLAFVSALQIARISDFCYQRLFLATYNEWPSSHFLPHYVSNTFRGVFALIVSYDEPHFMTSILCSCYSHVCHVGTCYMSETSEMFWFF